ELDSKHSAAAWPGAFGSDSSVMQFDNRFRDRQTKTQSTARLQSSYISLLKRPENKWQSLAIDPDTIITDRHDKLSGNRICRPHDDLATGRRELDRILE